jgi:hypothetical protein
MTFDPRSLLPPDEVVRPRTPVQLRRWVLDRCDAISRTPEAKQLGLFKKFYEEVYPFSLFAVRRYGERDDVECVPNMDDSSNFDSVVREASREVKVEITLAYPPLWHLRMEHLVKHGMVGFYGPLSVEGSRRRNDRQTTAETMLVDHPEEVALHLRLVKQAAEGKAGPGRYGSGYELLVVVEDSWFSEQDSASVAEFLEREIMTLPLCFDALHVVGRTDRLHKSVVIPR